MKNVLKVYKACAHESIPCKFKHLVIPSPSVDLKRANNSTSFPGSLSLPLSASWDGKRRDPGTEVANNYVCIRKGYEEEDTSFGQVQGLCT